MILTLARPIIKVKLFSMRFYPVGVPAGFSRIYAHKAGIWVVLSELIPVVEVWLYPAKSPSELLHCLKSRFSAGILSAAA